MAHSFEKTFESEFAPLHRYLRRRVGESTADELAAQTFATAYASWDRLDPTRPVRPWLYGIAANLLRHHWRSERRMLRAYARTGVDPVVADDDATLERLDAEARRRVLAAALAELRPHDREILLLHAWAELSDSEIAAALSLPTGTVKIAPAPHARTSSEPPRPAWASSGENVELPSGGLAMTDSTPRLLRDFRAEVAEPGEETARRIYALVTAPTTGKQREVDGRWYMRRSRLALALAAVALLAVPTAVAFGGKIVDLFRGTPAPAEISTNFAGFNRMADKLADFSTRQGFALTMPHADVSKAHGVIEIETPDGPQDLWAAPSDQGGNCYFIDWVDDPSSATGKLGIGGCDPSPAPVSKINWGQVWFRPHPDLVTVWGSVFVDAATVKVVLESGSVLTLPIVERLFLGSLAKGEKVVKVTALDTSGKAVARWTKPR